VRRRRLPQNERAFQKSRRPQRRGLPYPASRRAADLKGEVCATPLPEEPQTSKARSALPRFQKRAADLKGEVCATLPAELTGHRVHDNFGLSPFAASVAKMGYLSRPL
jgi:hypothetical protein